MEGALGYLEPFAGAGADASSLLSELLGLQGPEAARGAYARFVNPPGFQEAVDFGTDTALQTGVNFGNLRSGATMKALQGVGQRTKYNALQDWLNRLTGQQGQGINIAGRQAGITERGFDRIGGAQAGGILGAGQAEAGGILGAAQARSAGTSNILKIAAGLGQAAMGMPPTAAGGVQAPGGFLPGGSNIAGPSTNYLPWLQANA